MDSTHLREALLAEKLKLESELSTVGRRNAANPADWEPVPSETGHESDPNDQATLIDSYGENTAILNDLETRYNEVLAALTRMEEGTYGTCTVDGGPIEPERLAADPAATTCIQHLS
jgi:DnaK suppressor protein